MAELHETLDTETKGNETSELTLTTETVVSLFTSLATGTHNNSRVTLEFSADGNVWRPGEQSTNGNGFITFIAAANKVKAVVLKGEGSAATANISIVAR